MAVHQSIIIDGSNLAHRVYHASKNIQGLHTESLEGQDTTIAGRLLQSVGALKRRFLHMSVCYVWGGSNQRRLKIDPEYKKGGSTLPDSVKEQVNLLRDLLPLLGVSQAENPEEEGDDVVASLNLKLGGYSIIVSNDMDFIQLVTRKTTLLKPKVGSGDEVAFDPDVVLNTYGFAPDGMRAWKSITGDSSDGISGVRGFKRATAKEIASTARSVEDILGTTAGSDKERAALKLNESKLRVNWDLIGLHRELPYTLTEGAIDLDLFESKGKLLGLPVEAILDPFKRAKQAGFLKVGGT